MRELLMNLKANGPNGRWQSQLGVLSRAEKVAFGGLIGAVILLIGFDLYADFSAQQSLLHIALDFCFGFGAIGGLLLTWLQMGRARQSHVVKIAEAENHASTAQDEAARWKLEAEAIQKGIADEIELQLQAWSLTPSEKEVAFLLLKGLSIKEISTVRGTAERTVRHQTLAIYSKAGVTGRAELSAFFLEEFLDRQGAVAVLSPRIKAMKRP